MMLAQTLIQTKLEMMRMVQALIEIKWAVMPVQALIQTK
jgi:hypothetical protein